MKTDTECNTNDDASERGHHHTFDLILYNEWNGKGAAGMQIVRPVRQARTGPD